MQAHLPMAMQETQLVVRSDALHVGDRCVKRGPTKGICDLCYCLLGLRVAETTRHICLECPFTKPVVTAIWKDGLLNMRAEPLTNPQVDDDTFCQLFERRIALGVADFDPPHLRPPKHLRAMIAALAAATNAALIRRRNHNAFCTAAPLQYEPARLVRTIMDSVCATSTALRTMAEREETRIYTHFEGWLPDEDDRPMAQWRASWYAMVRDTYPKVRLHHPTPFQHTHASAQCPDVDLDSPDVAARLRSRSVVSY